MYAQETIKPYGDKEGKRSQVERMFNNIAHSYDKLNHTLSLGVDRIWRRSSIKHLKRIAQPQQILDIATGTGDFAILAAKNLCPKHIVGVDISDGMMEIGMQKVIKAGLKDIIEFRHEDCSKMSFADNQFDAVISSFGLRNFANLDDCLKEMLRVTTQGGHIVAIDLCAPSSFPMKELFWIYKKVVMPVVGRCISHDNSAYTYLPSTMDAIPQGETMADIFRKAGWADVEYKRLAFGMCMRYTAIKK